MTALNNKDQETLIEIKKHKIDICALSETKKKGKGNTKYEDHILIYSGKEKNERAASGVGLLIHQKFETNIKDIKYVSDRLLQVTLNLHDKKPTHFISVYAPDITKPQEERENFYTDLQNTLDKIPIPDEVIILGDFNARIGNEVIAGIKHRFNEETLNENGETLIHFCAQNELRINNTFYPHKIQHKWTFENTRGQKSMIDYVLTNRNIHPTKILDVRVLTSANTGTNHNLVMAKIRYSSITLKQKQTKTTEKLNVESFANETTKYLFQQRLTQKIRDNKIHKDDDVETAWKKTQVNILGAAEEALGKRLVKYGGIQRKPWFCEEVKDLAEEKRKSYLQYRSKSITYDAYKVVRNRINSAIKMIKQGYWEKFSSDMEHDLYGAQKKVWGMLRNRKKPVSEYIQLPTITPDQWEEYFRDLYKASSQSGCESPPEHAEEQNLINTFHFSEDDLKKTIGKLKNRKAHGPDGIPNELIKYGGDPLSNELTTLFNKILQTGKIPTSWKESTTIPIFKKGTKTDPKNYRGITLLSAVLKLMTKILAEVIAETGINEEQQGFRKNRSTIDAIFILRQIAEKSIEHNKPAFMCFVDLTQAFDRVRLADVLRLLEKRHIDTRIIAIIKELNTGNVTTIKTGNQTTNKIPVADGIRQGDSLSPILFNLVMDEIIDEVKNAGRGYSMGRNSIKIVCYADDAVLVAEDEDDLQRMLYRFERTAEKFNMVLSVDKTESLAIAKEPKRCKLAIYNQTVNQVMSFKYLGANITSNRDLKEEVRTQVTKATLISGFLRDIVWRNKYMSIRSKTRIYKTCVRPIMAYAGETRAETAVTKRLLRTGEMKTLRAITGHSLRDHRRNDEIRQQCEVEDVVRWIRTRRRGWRDHVDRMADDRIAKIAKNSRPLNVRPPGRPPKRWYESWTSGSQE